MNRRVLIVSSAKTKESKRRRPSIRIAGFWLNEIGFDYDKLVEISCEYGLIVLKVVGQGVETYNKVVKDIRKNNSSLLQVKRGTRNKKYIPYIEAKGFWLEQFGFKISDVIILEVENEIINIKLLDIDAVTNKKTFYINEG